MVANKICKTKEQMYVKIGQTRPAHIKRNKQRELAKGKWEKKMRKEKSTNKGSRNITMTKNGKIKERETEKRT